MATEQHTRITVLISGNGSNLQALMDACDSSLRDCTIVRVISNRKSAHGLTRASNGGIPTKYLNLLKYKKQYDNIELARAKYDEDLAQSVLDDKPDIVVCAGWMHILTPKFLDPVAEAGVPVINLHPALPGRYNGANAIERAHKDFMEGKTTETGIMIHYVIAEVDMGEPILVEPISLSRPVDDDIDALEQRIHQLEWKVIVEGTKKAIVKLWKDRDAKDP